MVRATFKMRSWARAVSPMLLHGALKQALGLRSELAVGADLPGGHLIVRVDLLAVFPEAFTLPEPSAAAEPRSSLYWTAGTSM